MGSPWPYEHAVDPILFENEWECVDSQNFATGDENTADKNVHCATKIEPTAENDVHCATRNKDTGKKDVHCEDCDLKEGQFFCGSCDQRYCSDCWEDRSAHRRKHPLHQKVEVAMHEHFERILQPRWTSKEREARHGTDVESLWFAIEATNSSDLNCQELPRFATLAKEHKNKHGPHLTYYPRLISFIGGTGSGKSTLIRMLLEQPWLTKNSTAALCPDFVPVVGKPLSLSVLPTSGDVHLYSKPCAATDRDVTKPLFYADCEGFDGGPTAPAGSFATQKARHNQSEEPGTRKWLMNFLLSTCRLHKITDDSVKSRDSAVRKTFPRLLYNFSDVIVFVVHIGDAFKMQDAFVQILTWAEASAASAVNRPALPNLIVVINQVDHLAEWDSEIASANIFGEHEVTFKQNPKIQEYRESLEKQGIFARDLRDLICKSYSTVRFIYVPSGGMRIKMSEQLGTLSKMIDDASTETFQQKKSVDMVLPSRQQNLFFNYAFSHYTSRDADKPFDFLKKLMSMNPMPITLSANFHRLMAVLLENSKTTREHAGAQAFLDQVGPTIASLVALDAMRYLKRVPGTLRTVYQGFLAATTGTNADGDADATHTANSSRPDIREDSYEHAVSVAIKKLCNESCECEYADANGTKCTLALRGHQTGLHSSHNAVSIRNLGEGDFKSEFVKKLEFIWRTRIGQHMDQLDVRIKSIIAGLTDEDPQLHRAYATWTAHCETLEALMKAFPQAQLVPQDIVSPCVYCWRELGTNRLPCSHIVCEACARSLEESQHLHQSRWNKDERFAEVLSCLLHEKPYRFSPCVRLETMPPFASPRLLSLDGGGVRGIIEMKIMAAIQARLGNQIPLSRFFDLITGTSTGALAALGVGMYSWTTSECEQKYRKLCQSAFTPASWYDKVIHGCSYDTHNFETLVRNEFKQQRILTHEHTTTSPRNKVCVTATKDEGQVACVFTNYLRAYDTHQGTNQSTNVYDYEMQYDHSREFKVWQVARAACAAPSYFRHMTIDSDDYMDGGLRHNNPALIAFEEARKLWPAMISRHPDLLLSIGSGCQTEPARKNHDLADMLKNQQRRKDERSLWKFWKWRSGWLETLSALQNLLLQNMESEQMWNERFRTEVERAPRHFIRLNPKLTSTAPELDDVKALNDGVLDNVVSQYLKDKSFDVDRVAARLIATSFYFHPTASIETDPDGSVPIKGFINCRFVDSSDVSHFCDLLIDKIGTKGCLRFEFASSSKYSIEIDVDVLEDKKADGRLKFPFSFVIPPGQQEFVIDLHLHGKETSVQSISGCPFDLRDRVGGGLNERLGSLAL